MLTSDVTMHYHPLVPSGFYRIGNFSQLRNVETRSSQIIQNVEGTGVCF